MTLSYNPLRLFLPLGLPPGTLGSAKLVYDGVARRLRGRHQHPRHPPRRVPRVLDRPAGRPGRPVGPHRAASSRRRYSRQLAGPAGRLRRPAGGRLRWGEAVLGVTAGRPLGRPSPSSSATPTTSTGRPTRWSAASWLGSSPPLTASSRPRLRPGCSRSVSVRARSPAGWRGGGRRRRSPPSTFPTRGWPVTGAGAPFAPLFAAGEALPFPDATFDLVVAVEVLEHVCEPAATLREIARVTRRPSCSRSPGSPSGGSPTSPG